MRIRDVRVGCAVLLLTTVPALAAAPPPPGVVDGRVSGKIKERHDAGGYSYLLVATAAGDQWAAVPQVEAAAGDAVTIAVQAQMGGFESKSLKRKFEKIFFGTVEGKQGPLGHPADPAAARPGPPPSELAAPAPRSASGIEGEVKEVLQVPGYTYARLAVAKDELWAAVPTAELRVGQRVRVEKPAAMDGFKSKTLNRTFERIVFGSLGEVTAPSAP